MNTAIENAIKHVERTLLCRFELDEQKCWELMNQWTAGDWEYNGNLPSIPLFTSEERDEIKRRIGVRAQEHVNSALAQLICDKALGPRE